MSSIDQLVYQAHFGTETEQKSAHAQLTQLAQQQGVVLASIHDFYLARGQEKIPANFTVPAMNLRGLSYLTAQAAFEAAQELDVGAMIFELARSEMKYTDQNPYQFASSVIGAALTADWHGPVFIQGDHYQPKAEQPGVIKTSEVESIKNLIVDSLAAGFYNLDIDGSTLVDVDQPTEYDQQRANFLFTADMFEFVAGIQPAGITVALGCEVSEVGTHLSKSSQLSAFMTGLRDEGGLHRTRPIKVAVETGTAHGGVVNHDGTSAPMFVDFDRLKILSILARHKYQMAGAVQHGASTLDKSVFGRFPESEAAEIHLSTGFQNLILDHPAFPQDIIDEMYAWCDEHLSTEKKPAWSPAQFYVKLRKKAWKHVKEKTWNLPIKIQVAIKASLKAECHSYFTHLNVTNTRALMASWGSESSASSQ